MLLSVFCLAKYFLTLVLYELMYILLDAFDVLFVCVDLSLTTQPSSVIMINPDVPEVTRLNHW